MYIYYNPNPKGKQVGDCVIRALSKALKKTWDKTFLELILYGYSLCDMPAANYVWGTLLTDKGYKRQLIDDYNLPSYTVKDFCEDHQKGEYILSLSNHVVAVIDGNYYDSWDSGNETPLYYWEKRKTDVL